MKYTTTAILILVCASNMCQIESHYVPTTVNMVVSDQQKAHCIKWYVKYTHTKSTYTAYNKFIICNKYKVK
jgi:hypothetical protein